MDGIKGYTRPGPRGGVIVDYEAMTVDLVTILKAAGYSRAEAFEFFSGIFDGVQVTVDTSRVKRDS